MALDNTVKLTPTQVQEAIAFYLRTHGLKSTKVDFNTRIQHDGDERMGGSSCHVFSGAAVNVVPTNENTPFSSLAAQIAAVESGKVQP